MTYSRYQFSIFRIVLGLYLLIHFAMLLPYGHEMFGRGGTLASPDLNLTYGLFPSVVFWIDSDAGITAILALLCILSLAFMLGAYRRLVSLLLWFGWASLFNANNFISNPGIPYVGWLLLACAMIPPGEPWSVPTRSAATTAPAQRWQMPPAIYCGAWLILALGYGVSGYGKLISPSWQDGSAFVHLLNTPLARDIWLRDAVLALPDYVHKIHTWAALGFELAFAPLCLWLRGRAVAWGVMVAMHVGILTLVSFADLTFGMLIVHLFTFDGRWIPPRPSRSNDPSKKPVVFFDGVCGLCNSFVDFLLEHDKTAQYMVSPLQSEFAAKVLPAQARQLDAQGDYKSFVLLSDTRVYQRSAAVLRVLVSLGGIWTIFYLAFVIPAFARDPVYDFIARHRYRLFGKKETCRMPTPEERARFIL